MSKVRPYTARVVLCLPAQGTAADSLRDAPYTNRVYLTGRGVCVLQGGAWLGVSNGESPPAPV